MEYKVDTLIQTEVDKMIGTTESYYKEKLRNGLQDICKDHFDELHTGPDVKILTKLTNEAIEIAHKQIPQIVLRIYMMDTMKTIQIYTEVYDILEKVSKLK
jgi:hypothetical protein